MAECFNEPVLVHLGFPKALSSWLQKQWFVPGNGYQTVMDPLQVQQKIIDSTPFAWTSEAAANAIKKNRQADLLPVITSEALSGNMYSGGYNGKECIDRVLQLAPQARLLLVVREQRALIRSLYKSLVTWGMPHSIDRILKPVEPRLSPQFNLDFLRFDQRVAYYQQLVGKDRLLVLPYEMFTRQPQVFLQSIQEFAGVDGIGQLDTAAVGRKINAGQTLLNLYIQRWLNYFFLSGPFNYSGLFRAGDAAWQKRIARSKRNPLPAFTSNWFEASFAKKVERAVAGQFGESNRRLQALTGLQLEQYGYQILGFSAGLVRA